MTQFVVLRSDGKVVSKPMKEYEAIDLAKKLNQNKSMVYDFTFEVKEIIQEK